MMTEWNEDTKRRIYEWMEVKTQGSFLSVQDVASALKEIKRLEKELHVKIGPDWREALSYETEFELMHRIKELEDDVLTYGNHEASCIWFEDGEDCNCGFDKVLVGRAEG